MRTSRNIPLPIARMARTAAAIGTLSGSTPRTTRQHATPRPIPRARRCSLDEVASLSTVGHLALAERHADVTERHASSCSRRTQPPGRETNTAAATSRPRTPNRRNAETRIPPDRFEECRCGVSIDAEWQLVDTPPASEGDKHQEERHRRRHP
jgi:hypothetical protein